MLELWPFTNFHDLNLDWIIKTIKSWTTSMQSFVDQMTADWQDMHDDWQDFIDDTYKDQITEILQDHPEWTTTVQDGAITFQKLNGSIQAFTTPEAFGAAGDGVTDDTQAWQDAVDTGIPVVATKKNYKTGTITVPDGAVIDCNNAEFYCTSDVLFDIHGEIVAPIYNLSDYVSGTPSYSIGDTTYNGLIYCVGTNNFEKSRSYYKGGFVGKVINGLVKNRFPVDVIQPVVYTLNDITVDIQNIADIKHASYTVNTRSIKVLYGDNCTFKNINTSASSGYSVIFIEKSYDTKIENCSMIHTYGTVGTNSYPIANMDSTYTTIESCDIYNQYWHAISSGGETLVYRTLVLDCVLTTDDPTSYLDHENARGTIVKGCTLSSAAYLTGLSTIRDCVITQGGSDTNPICQIFFALSSEEDVAVYTADNIKLLHNASAAPTRVGIRFGTQNQVNDVANVYNLKQATVNNIYDANTSHPGDIALGIQATNGYKLQSINIDDCNLDVHLQVPHSVTYADVTDYKTTISNCNSRALAVGKGAAEFNGSMYISNSTIGLIQSIFTNLSLDSTTITVMGNASYMSITGELRGSAITGYLAPAMMNTAAYVHIESMFNNVVSGSIYERTYVNIVKESGHIMAQYWSSNVLTTATLI